ncbi:pre-mRNA-processing protein 40C-like [Pistacia vera]|uniref:pre-mRNA-processing protein 40C-like n=1 Tax=Pistacia vera TaxID=55513 RepID=UPI0012636CB5|nr:pre-mRNA-processing protein 40C-like [Pistacia vera]
MLKERGVAPFSKWDKELPKIVFDPHFKAIPSQSARRALFEHYVKACAEEERKEKQAAQKAVIEGFKQLLEEALEDIDHNTDYQTFRKKWGSDPRFEALDRKDRELLLNERYHLMRRI